MNAVLTTLQRRRCDHHPQREASARCPECERFYCRECITEHEDRVLCASCLARLTIKPKKETALWAWVPQLALALLAAAVIFFTLLLIGNGLLSLPSRFHESGGW